MPSRLLAERPRLAFVRSLLAGAFLIPLLGSPAHAADAPGTAWEVSGLEVRVVDLDQAISFFKLYGFELAGDKASSVATVRNGNSVIDLVKVPRKLDIDDAGVANTHLNLRVDNLATAIEELKAAGKYRFVGELRRKSPVGDYAVVKDPSGNIFHLMEPSSRPAEGIKRGVFNVGIAVSDMAKAREFYRDKLGFEIFSEDYFPPDLPLKRKGAMPLVLHETAKTAAAAGYPDIAETVVVLRTPDLAQAMKSLKAQGVRFLHDQPQQSPLGRYVAFVDPFGNVLELREPGNRASL